MDTSTPTQLLADIKAKTKLSEIAIAERLGTSQPTVNRILRGKSECKSGTLLAIQRWHGELALEPTAEGDANRKAGETVT
ncbi:helix-turn-helix domain-containing protein [Burkholderia sp. JKS000303]|uniref:helix-turn-helix domain-containing protein n=1 Tax=Burkholderia sp. JKS000303 TaxID=1938747 RepID=UPI001180E4A5|nr:helix-turn-helix transcriptional regulator [Burkholderia sp. JKS000303]